MDLDRHDRRVGWGMVVVALMALAALGGWYLGRPVRVVETPAPEIRQGDGSIVLGRQPDAGAKPAHAVPRGARVERVAAVTVRAAAPGTGLKAGQGAAGSLMALPDCPPVTVDLSLVRLGDQTRRVVASSRDGIVVGGLDVPVESAAVAEPRKWAAGWSYDPIHRTPGVWVDRDIGRFRVGAEIVRSRPLGLNNFSTDTQARIRVGWTW